MPISILTKQQFFICITPSQGHGLILRLQNVHPAEIPPFVFYGLCSVLISFKFRKPFL